MAIQSHGAADNRAARDLLHCASTAYHVAQWLSALGAAKRVPLGIAEMNSLRRLIFRCVTEKFDYPKTHYVSPVQPMQRSAGVRLRSQRVFCAWRPGVNRLLVSVSASFC